METAGNLSPGYELSAVAVWELPWPYPSLRPHPCFASYLFPAAVLLIEDGSRRQLPLFGGLTMQNFGKQVLCVKWR